MFKPPNIGPLDSPYMRRSLPLLCLLALHGASPGLAEDDHTMNNELRFSYNNELINESCEV